MNENQTRQTQFHGGFAAWVKLTPPRVYESIFRL